jgi:hypothetical protein
VPPADLIGTAPQPAPARPLTGAAPTLTLLPTGPTLVPSATLRCLWYDEAVSPSLSAGADSRRYGAVAWLDGAHALAEVLVEDAALDATNPYTGTKLDGAAYVVHAGETYRVVAVHPVGASFALPTTYFVWLAGASNQAAP